VRGVRVADAETAAARAKSLILGIIASTGRTRLAVPGGRTPGRIFELLASSPRLLRDVEILFADERAVPLDDPESNYRLLREKLLAPLGDQAPRAIPMRADADDLEAAAREYERHLEEPLTVVLLGIGQDGHIASLFPRSPLLDEQERRVCAVYDSPKPPPRRLTLTPRALGEAESICVVATGAGKRAAVARALSEEGDEHDCPARLVRDAFWIVDADAAADLDESVLPRE
jgi:6-phosphogluconolactonase